MNTLSAGPGFIVVLSGVAEAIVFSCIEARYYGIDLRLFPFIPLYQNCVEITIWASMGRGPEF